MPRGSYPNESECPLRNSKLSVIANQSADWCGNPPVERNQETITTKNRNDFHSSGHFSVHFPSNRGIATPLKRTGSQ